LIHGSGGGFDQGEILGDAVLGPDFHWIAPSRFGYLRSTLPPGATSDEQAHAYAYLLDRLGVDRSAVIALSHGGPSALLLAALHPQRVSSLTLLSCGVASQPSSDQDAANRKGNLLTTVFRHDPLYWLAMRFWRGQLMELLGANEAIVERLDSDQRALIDRVIEEMYPVTPRSAGVIFDNQATLPNERIAAIRAPTLILHAVDDSLQLYANALFAAEKIPGARLVSFERGGHLVMAIERDHVRRVVQEHLRTAEVHRFDHR
jgi:pimeloyl-ACP methyl ester carboxylesterase